MNNHERHSGKHLFRVAFFNTDWTEGEHLTRECSAREVWTLVQKWIFAREEHNDEDIVYKNKYSDYPYMTIEVSKNEQEA